MYNHNKFIKLSKLPSDWELKQDFKISDDADLDDSNRKFLNWILEANKRLDTRLDIGTNYNGKPFLISFELLNYNANLKSKKTGKRAQFNVKSRIVYAFERFFINVLFDENLSIPFYCSTGTGGKKNVATNKWYPFFGIGESWFNKGRYESDISNYYNSTVLKKIAEWLDKNIGSYRDEEMQGVLPVKDEHNDQLKSRINLGKNPAQHHSNSEDANQNRINTLLTLNKLLSTPESSSWRDFIFKSRVDVNTIFEWFDGKSRFYFGNDPESKKISNDLIKNHNGKIKNNYIIFDNPESQTYYRDYLFLENKITFNSPSDSTNLMLFFVDELKNPYYVQLLIARQAEDISYDDSVYFSLTYLDLAIASQFLQKCLEQTGEISEPIFYNLLNRSINKDNYFHKVLKWFYENKIFKNKYPERLKLIQDLNERLS